MSRTTPNLSKQKVRAPYDGQPPKTKLTQYVGFFAIGFVIASAILMMIQSKFALNPQLVAGLSIIIGAYVAVYKFIKHKQRALSKNETNRLSLSSTGVVWLLTAVYFLGLWLFLFDTASREVLVEMTTEQPLPLLFALAMMIIFTLIAARISIWALNRLLAPK